MERKNDLDHHSHSGLLNSDWRLLRGPMGDRLRVGDGEHHMPLFPSYGADRSGHDAGLPNPMAGGAAAFNVGSNFKLYSHQAAAASGGGLSRQIGELWGNHGTTMGSMMGSLSHHSAMLPLMTRPGDHMVNHLLRNSNTMGGRSLQAGLPGNIDDGYLHDLGIGDDAHGRLQQSLRMWQQNNYSPTVQSMPRDMSHLGYHASATPGGGDLASWGAFGMEQASGLGLLKAQMGQSSMGMGMGMQGSASFPQASSADLRHGVVGQYSTAGWDISHIGLASRVEKQLGSLGQHAPLGQHGARGHMASGGQMMSAGGGMDSRMGGILSGGPASQAPIGQGVDEGEAVKRKRKRKKRDEGEPLEGDRHHQFRWLKRMGQQNLPRSGLFKPGGSAGPSFMRLLEELEMDGVITRRFVADPGSHGGGPGPPSGVTGWTVAEDQMDEWKRRRQAWFMQGKEGKVFKPNSLYQIFRRLGYFPTLLSAVAGHGHDFQCSRVYAWDEKRRYVQARLKDKHEQQKQEHDVG